MLDIASPIHTCSRRGTDRASHALTHNSNHKLSILCLTGGGSGGSGPIAPTTSIDVASANDLNKTGHSTHSRGESLAEDDAMCVVCLDRPASAGFVHGDRCGALVVSHRGESLHVCC